MRVEPVPVTGKEPKEQLTPQMRVFIAGSTGAVGRFLVPHLVEKGLEVVALVRSA